MDDWIEVIEFMAGIKKKYVDGSRPDQFGELAIMCKRVELGHRTRELYDQIQAVRLLGFDPATPEPAAEPKAKK